MTGDADLATNKSVIQVKEIRRDKKSTVANRVREFTADGGDLDGIKALSNFGDYSGKTPVFAVSKLVQNYPNELADLQQAANRKNVILEFFD